MPLKLAISLLLLSFLVCGIYANVCSSSVLLAQEKRPTPTPTPPPGGPNTSNTGGASKIAYGGETVKSFAALLSSAALIRLR